MVIFYTTNGINTEVGVLKKFSLDYEVSTEPNENVFQLRTSLDNDMLSQGDWIYADDDNEIGGIVDAKRINTKDKTITYTGRTWRGLLASKIIEPTSPLGTPMNYYVVDGDLSACVNEVVNHSHLDNLFEVDTTATGVILSNYQFYRYTDAYSGIIKMLSDNGYKMQIRFSSTTKMCTIYVVPIVDYSNEMEMTSDLFNFDITKVAKPLRHLIALGKGELANRQVVHLYSDANGNIRDTPQYALSSYVDVVYDYSSVESLEELRESATEYLEELFDSDVIQITPNDINADIGDKFTAYDENTGTGAVQIVQSKIYTITEDSVKADYVARTVVSIAHKGYQDNEIGIRTGFSNVTVDSTTIASELEMDTLTLASGNGITLTPDVSDKSITIKASLETHTQSIPQSGTTSIANSTADSPKKLGEFELEAGKWFVSATVRFNSNATGNRYMEIQQGGSSLGIKYQDLRTAISGNTTYLCVNFIANPTSNTTYSIYVSQNSGGALATLARVHWIGIKA